MHARSETDRACKHAPYSPSISESRGSARLSTTNEAMLKAASPVFHADRITAPLLIAQGAKDPRVVKSESDQMVEAMRKRGVSEEQIASRERCPQ